MMPGGTKPKIVITASIDRPDILSTFQRVAADAVLTFVDYYFNWGVPSHPEHYQPYGALRFWDEFRSANALLDELRPDKVVFFFITSLNQVALKIAAQQRGIPTFHLEHGFRQRFADSAEGFAMELDNRRRFNVPKLRRELPHIIRNHAFFVRSLPSVRPPQRQQLFRYGLTAYTRGLSIDVLAKHGRLRQPDRYIAYSPEIFEFHRELDAVTPEDMQRVTYIGLPQFDPYCNLPPAEIDPRNVILIDHQWHGSNFFGWTLAFRHEWVRQIDEIIRALGLRLFVKQHPGDTSNAWAPYVAKGGVEIVDHERLRQVLPSTQIVLGNFSTMQLPLSGLSHTALITLEIHPEPGHFASRQFVEAGVATPVTTFPELREKLVDFPRLLGEQGQHKETFVRRFLHRMDGNSGMRLRDILLHG
jgi:hypothetical protein